MRKPKDEPATVWMLIGAAVSLTVFDMWDGWTVFAMFAASILLPVLFPEPLGKRNGRSPA